MKKLTNKIEHNMIREIREQGHICRKIIEKYVDCGKKSINFSELIDCEHKIKSTKKIIFLACGTSYYAGIYGKYIFEEFAGIDCSVEYADEFNSRTASVKENTIVISMSQSGETSDVVTSVKKAKKMGAFVIGITNGVDSSLSKESDVVIYNDAGKELALAATKSYTSQLLLLSLLAVKFAQVTKVFADEINSDFFSELDILPNKINDVLKFENDIEKIANEYNQNESLIVLGKKYNYLTALEGAHKLKETTYVHAEGSSSEEFIHGPNAIIDKNFPTIFIMPLDSTYKENFAVYKKVNSEGAKNIVLTTVANSIDNKNTIFIPEIKEYFSSILYIIPIQIFAYYLAGSRKIDVDNLRNISKCIIKN